MYIEKQLHFYSTTEAFEAHRKADLINPDSICFLKESGQIYTQNTLFGICRSRFERLEQHVLELDAKMQAWDKEGGARGRYKDTTFADLWTLYKDGSLSVGSWYRITDYITETFQENTASYKHLYDLLVLATSGSTLSERAYACYHDGDDYFKGCDIGAWQLWYDIDASHYHWADGSKTGVVYRMIDEYGNDCPYDFKNIIYKGLYTFGGEQDKSLDGRVKNNVIGQWADELDGWKVKLPCNVFKGDTHGMRLGGQCRYNEFIGEAIDCTFGNDCFENKFNNVGNSEFGIRCAENDFSKVSVTNCSFGVNCHNNTSSVDLWGVRFCDYICNLSIESDSAMQQDCTILNGAGVNASDGRMTVKFTKPYFQYAAGDSASTLKIWDYGYSLIDWNILKDVLEHNKEDFWAVLKALLESKGDDLWTVLQSLFESKKNELWNVLKQLFEEKKSEFLTLLESVFKAGDATFITWPQLQALTRQHQIWLSDGKIQTPDGFFMESGDEGLGTISFEIHSYGIGTGQTDHFQTNETPSSLLIRQKGTSSPKAKNISQEELAKFKITAEESSNTNVKMSTPDVKEWCEEFVFATDQASEIEMTFLKMHTGSTGNTYTAELSVEDKKKILNGEAVTVTVKSSSSLLP